jgi:phytoene dehydrogenase-like protein
VEQDVIIIGAGLSGLSCARQLNQRGLRCTVLEASDGVGGRVRTDTVEGFRLDRGFQVFLTSYPEAKANLNYRELDLKPFLPGALIRYQGRFYELTDPWRRPLSAFSSLFSPIGSLHDKLRIAALRSKTLKGTLTDQFSEPEVSSLKLLQEMGFSSLMINRFFRPFLGGIFLDAELQTSSRMLNFVFRMFSLGSACLPSQGMEAIPKQLAASLPTGCIRLSTKVDRVESGSVSLSSGQHLTSKCVVVATEGPAAAKLLGDSITSQGQGTTCLYFSASSPPIEKPILVLNGDGQGPINNLCVPTVAARTYGPSDKSLISVTVLGTLADPNQLVRDVSKQLEEWFGDVVQQWKHLRTYSIPYALPHQNPPALENPERAVRWSAGVYVCGDHRDNASIQGAMVSGRRAAEAVLKDFA